MSTVPIHWFALMPILLVAGIGLVAMLLSAFMKDSSRIGYFTVAALAGTAGYTALYWAKNPSPHLSMFNGSVVIDGVSLFFYVLLLMISAVTCLVAIPYLERESAQHGEFYTMIAFILVGMLVMVSSNDLITAFLGFETMSIGLYVICGWRRHVLVSNEAAIKYYFLGAFAAGIFLYGIALVYGTLGSTNLIIIRDHVMSGNIATLPLAVLGILMIIVALAFKVAAFPFHMWTPDVYEGAPTPVTGFMATAVKAAAFGLVLRVFADAFYAGDFAPIAANVTWWLAVVTMFAGNVFALVQKNLKRMLAYSGIAHTGYLLVGITALYDRAGSVAAGHVVLNLEAASAILFYLVGYAFTNLGALACVSFLNAKEERLQNIEDFAGAAWRYPIIGLGMAVCFLSLIGFPPTAGFFGKYYLFIAAIKGGYTPLVAIAVINSILSVYYYLRVLVVLFMKPEAAKVEGGDKLPAATRWAIAYATVAVLWAGFGTVNLTGALPGAATLIETAKASVASMAATSPVPTALLKP